VFVVGSLPCSERFSPDRQVFHSVYKPTAPKFQFDLECTNCLVDNLSLRLSFLFFSFFSWELRGRERRKPDTAVWFSAFQRHELPYPSLQNSSYSKLLLLVCFCNVFAGYKNFSKTINEQICKLDFAVVWKKDSFVKYATQSFLRQLPRINPSATVSVSFSRY